MDYIELHYLCHHGIKGMKWGVRRFQNEDGSLTPKGQKRYAKEYASYNKGNVNSYEKHKSMVVTAVSTKAIKAEDMIKLRQISNESNKVFEEKEKLLGNRSKTNLQKQDKCLDAYVDFVYGKDTEDREYYKEDIESYDDAEGTLMNPNNDPSWFKNIEKQAGQGNKEAIVLLNALKDYQSDPESIKISKLMDKEMELYNEERTFRKKITDDLLGKYSSEQISWGMLDYDEAVDIANEILKEKR